MKSDRENEEEEEGLKERKRGRKKREEGLGEMIRGCERNST